jgi:hypothetical protein
VASRLAALACPSATRSRVRNLGSVAMVTFILAVTLAACTSSTVPTRRGSSTSTTSTRVLVTTITALRTTTSTSYPTTGPGDAGGPGPCRHARIPLFYPSATGADPTGQYVFFALDCTPNFLAQEPNPPKEFNPVTEDGGLVSSTEYRFMIPGVQAASPTTERPESTFTVSGSVLTASGNPGNQVASVTMTEGQVPVPGAADGSTTEGVEVIVSFDRAVTSCMLPSALGMGNVLLQMDCVGG